jgi:hypothetical protein
VRIGIDKFKWLAAGAILIGLSGWGAGCTLSPNPAMEQLAREPLPSERWTFADHPGQLIKTEHFRIYTTIDDPLYMHMMTRVLEATHARCMAINPQFRTAEPLECFVFSSRREWESYTRAQAGSNGTIYLQISSGGYCQKGIFAGYDIGRDQTLSVVAHEAWHQYAYFAFRDRIPAWLDEGLATQNEAIVWKGTDPVFEPEMNWRRLAALRQAMRTGTLWKLSDLLATHAGRVIKMSQPNIDAYYSQLWSFVLFLQQSPVYGPKLQSLLADATAGKLTYLLKGTSVTQVEIDNFSEHWNTVAGPLYAQKYLNADLDALEKEYTQWLKTFPSSGHMAL